MSQKLCHGKEKRDEERKGNKQENMCIYISHKELKINKVLGSFGADAPV